MSYFAAVLARRGDRWSAEEAELDECESLEDLGELLSDLDAEVRLLLIEQNDEYAALVRLDAGSLEPRAFLTVGHAADEYRLAAVVAEDLAEVGGDELEDDPRIDIAELPARDSAPFGDAEIVTDLGTSAGDLLAMCEHEGTLPVDLLLAICEKAGCAEVFEDLRG